MIKLALTFIALMFFSINFAWSHARFVTPAPRNNMANIKDSNNLAPCGTVDRSANPTKYTPGQVISVTVEETIQHNGRFQIRLSRANDTGFENEVLSDVTDDIVRGTQVINNVQLPNVECTTCTLQMVQVMMDNAVPSNYYSCADIIITANTTPPPVVDPPPATDPPPAADNGGNNSSQDISSNSSTMEKPDMGGCGLVGGGNTPFNPPPAGIALLFLPLFLLLYLRQKKLAYTKK